MVKLQWTEVAVWTGQNSNAETSDKTSCFPQLCVTEFSLEVVHGLLVHISCSVSVDPTFGQGGNTRHAGSFCEESAYTAELQRLLRWSCSDPECDCDFGNCHKN